MERKTGEQIGHREVLLSINGLKVEYGMRTVFENLNLSVIKGDKLALAGPNGAGKTTLIKSILGISYADSGSIKKKRDVRISYVPQSSDDINLDDDLSVENYIYRSGGLDTIQDEVHRLYAQLEKHPNDTRSLNKLGELQTEFENMGGYQIVDRTKMVLAGLGLQNLNLNKRLGTLSGGEKMKVFIAQAIASQPDLLILDEPTNHIDRKALDWLGNFLSSSEESVLAVSHDPKFLDRFVSRVVEIVPERSGLVEYDGNYTTFLKKKSQADSLRRREIEKLEEQSSRSREIGEKLKAGSQSGVGKARLIHAARLDEDIARLSEGVIKEGRRASIDFKVENPGPRSVLSASGLRVEIGNKSLGFPNLDIRVERGQRWLIKGETGTGKSVLLETIAGNIKVVRGNLNVNRGVDVGYFSQDHEDLDTRNNLIDEIRSVDRKVTEQKARSILGHFLFSGDDQLKEVSVLSQGERSRVALAKLVTGKHNLLLIDEPTNHLDINTRARLIESLQNYNGTMLLVSQDSDFIESINITHCLSLPSCSIKNL